MFSSRVPSERTANRIATRLARLRDSRVAYVDLTQSNPTNAGLDYPVNVIDGLDHPRGLSYSPSPFGAMSAREVVARDFARRGADVRAEHVTLTASTSEAYSLLFKLLCDPGDEVLVPRPSYPLFEHLTSLDAARTAPYDLEYHGTWTVDFQSVERSLSSRTRAMLVVNPNNPTGSFLTRSELDRIAEICRSKSLALIGDEVFADYSWNDTRQVSVLDQQTALTFSLGGLSKSVGLPQLKLGWMAVTGPSSLVGEAMERLEIICDTYLSVSTPVQLALQELLDRGAETRRRIRSRVMGNLGELERAISRYPSCTLLAAGGGWYAVVQVPATRPEEEMVLSLLDEDRVLVHPGYFFDFSSEAFMIVSLLPRPDEFCRGVEAMCRRFAGVS
jgi:aspartate/methionine/tyrosine aminotransferase